MEFIIRAVPESNLDEEQASRRFVHKWREHCGVFRKAVLVSWSWWGRMRSGHLWELGMKPTCIERGERKKEVGNTFVFHLIHMKLTVLLLLLLLFSNLWLWKCFVKLFGAVTPRIGKPFTNLAIKILHSVEPNTQLIIILKLCNRNLKIMF